MSWRFSRKAEALAASASPLILGRISLVGMQPSSCWVLSLDALGIWIFFWHGICLVEEHSRSFSEVDFTTLKEL